MCNIFFLHLIINRYVTTVVEDAKLVSNHSKKKIIDNEDIRLAVQMYNEQNFCSPPPKDVLLEVAQRYYPFKTSACLRGGGVKNLPNLPTDSTKKTAADRGVVVKKW